MATRIDNKPPVKEVVSPFIKACRIMFLVVVVTGMLTVICVVLATPIIFLGPFWGVMYDLGLVMAIIGAISLQEEKGNGS